MPGTAVPVTVQVALVPEARPRSCCLPRLTVTVSPRMKMLMSVAGALAARQHRVVRPGRHSRLLRLVAE
jgi:hypothetical protein